MGKCRYQSEWESRKDGHGYFIKEWARKDSDSVYKMFCIVCKRSFSVTGGFFCVEQHSRGEKHVEECKLQLNPNQLRFRAERPSSTTLSSSASQSAPVSSSASDNIGLGLYSVKDSTTVMELTWVLKCVKSNFSLASCVDMKDILKCMFPDQCCRSCGREVFGVPAEFSLGPTKAAYLLTEALSPYFKPELIKDINGAFYTLEYDETTNETGAKELQIVVRYFSESREKVVSQHLQTFFMGSAKAVEIVEKIYDALSENSLLREKLLMLGSDGPNVNISIKRKINDDMIAHRGKPLIDLGHCHIHLVHGAFEKGLKIFGHKDSNFIFDAHRFLKDWPKRKENFEEVQAKWNEKQRKDNGETAPFRQFIKHVPTRWLTLEPAAKRALELFDAFQEYIMEYIPKHDLDLAKTKSYQVMKAHFKNPHQLKAELHVACSSAHLFTRITGLFQKDEPLIHHLYSELHSLVTSLAGRACKPNAIKNFGLKSAFNEENLLPASCIILIDEVNQELTLSKISEKEKLLFMLDVRDHYVAAGRHTAEKSALTSSCAQFLEQCRVLYPGRRASTESLSDILGIARKMPFKVNADVLSDDWLLFQSENIAIEVASPVDELWAKVFRLKNSSGDPKYPTLSKVVRAALSLSHGNAGVERGFSDSSKALSEDRASMKERTLNALMTVSSGLKLHQSDISKVPTTRSLIKMAHGAYRSYSNYLDGQRQARETAIKKKAEEELNRRERERKLEERTGERRKLDKDEGLLKKLKTEEREKRKLAEKMVTEAQERLIKATQNKNMEEIQLAQGMLIVTA